jgi:hypothetical protein
VLEFKPRPYQEAGIDLMKRAPGCGLFLEPGSGKTVTALTAALEIPYGKMLVVAPNLVAREVWSREASKWKHTAHLSVQYLDVALFDLYRKTTTTAILGDETREIIEQLASEDDRWFLFMAEVAVSRHETRPRDWRKTKDWILRNPARIHVISRDHLYLLAKVLGEDWPYDMVIGDESTSWKNIESKRSVALLYLRRQGLVERLTLMSGTPSPKSVENLFAQVRLLDLGTRLGNKVGEFRKRFMVPSFTDKNGKARSWVNAPGAAVKVAEKIKDICLAVRADAWREVEPPRTVQRLITLPEQAMAQYHEMLRQWSIAVDDASVTAEQAAVLSNKLIQIATGAVFDDERQYHVLHDEKLLALDELIEELEGEPLIVVYWFRPTLARLKARYGDRLATVKTKGFLDRFARGELPLLALQPGSAGHGLDGLQDGGHHIAVVDVFHDWELYQQVVSRLDRSGQKHRVTVHQILAAGTKEETVALTLADKGASQAKVMDVLKYQGP